MLLSMKVWTKWDGSGKFEVLAALHGQVGLVLGHTHLLQDVGILDVIRQGIGEDVVVLYAFRQARFALRL